MKLLSPIFINLYFLTISCVVSAMDYPHTKPLQGGGDHNYKTWLEMLLPSFHDEIGILYEKEGENILDIYRDGNIRISIPLPLNSIADIQLSPDGSIYLLGKDQQRKDSIGAVKNGAFFSISSYEFTNIFSIQTGADGALYLLGKDQQRKDSIGIVKDSSPLQLLSCELTSIINMQAAVDGILYLLGKNSEEQRCIITIKAGDISMPSTYGLSNIFNMKIGPDSILYLLGVNQQEKNILLLVKQGKVMHHIPYDLREVQHIHVIDDKSCYLLGKDHRRKGNIILVKEGVASPPTTYGLRHIWDIQGSSGDTIYLRGENKLGTDSIVTIKGDYVSQPNAYGLIRIGSMQAGSNGSLYLHGKNSEREDSVFAMRGENITQLATTKIKKIHNIQVKPNVVYLSGYDEKNQKIAVVIRKEGEEKVTNVRDIRSIEKKQLTVNNILTTISSTIFSQFSSDKDDIDMPLFENLCKYIQFFPFNPVMKQEGMMLHNIFLKYLSALKGNAKASKTFLESLSYLINAQDGKGNYHPLCPYASAIVFMLCDPQDYFMQKIEFAPLQKEKIKIQLGEEGYQQRYTNTQNINLLLTIIQNSEDCEELKKLYRSYYEWVQIALKQLSLLDNQ
ncbi:hypothetical protein [Candidatus Odyssella acanthamoebae]|uniref:Uncharacterized protein n=1 Tax=Candidatus Odyssella acanthamoebae TaxID=91604 RepID=A0A077AXA0_9PROT|nr:hypothetical protein [Candidatus Paracaedibacter acanthamoebae]AIK96609.1 hypothetical protein ID47_07575 [Candidatus Paracaedibacter acanthamoebae]